MGEKRKKREKEANGRNERRTEVLRHLQKFLRASMDNKNKRYAPRFFLT